MPADHSSLATFMRSSRRPSPRLMTKTSVAFARPAASPCSLAFLRRSEKRRSTPNEMPTQGILPAALLSPANMPTRSSYLPPAAIDPTPTVESSTSASSSALSAGFLPLTSAFFWASVGAASGLGATGAGGAEPSVTAS